MTLLFGVALIINLRLFGFLRKASFASMHRLMPMGIFGFGICMVTGMLLFNANPTRYINVPTFFLKMFMIVIAGVAILYATVFDEAWALGSGDNPPLRAKFVAVSTVVPVAGSHVFRPDDPVPRVESGILKLRSVVMIIGLTVVLVVVIVVGVAGTAVYLIDKSVTRYESTENN